MRAGMHARAHLCCLCGCSPLPASFSTLCGCCFVVGAWLVDSGPPPKCHAQPLLGQLAPAATSIVGVLRKEGMTCYGFAHGMDSLRSALKDRAGQTS